MKAVNLQQILIEMSKVEFVDDDAFDGLPELQILSLSQNLLSYIPTAVTRIKKLQRLDLSANNIKSLKVGGNFITTINRPVFILSFNNIQAIQKGRPTSIQYD